MLGSFPDGADTVTIDLLNGNGSSLSVDSAALDGTPISDAALTLAAAGSDTFDFTGDGSLTPITLGSGADTLALVLSERGEPAGAEFTVSVDGAQVGGVQTTLADAVAGQSQTFDILGNFAPGANTVSIDYLNADDSLLTVYNATLNAASIPDSMVTASNDGAVAFSFVATGSLNPVTVGSGPDTLALIMSERDQPLDAQFTIGVNGQQIGGVQTTAADVLAGQSQEFDVLGTFGSGSTVSIDYLNADNSLLSVENATINGTAIADSALTLSNESSAGFGFSGPGNGGPLTIGSGADTLALVVAERAEPAGAIFTVDVDGMQVGGVQSATANSLQGQSETIDVLGNFAGPNTVTINYLNPDDSLLLVDSATLNGASVAGSAVTLSNQEAVSFSFSGAEVPADTTAVGDGPDQVALVMAQQGEPAGAEFTVDVDGTQIGGVQTVTADSTAGQSQTFDVLARIIRQG